MENSPTPESPAPKPVKRKGAPFNGAVTWGLYTPILTAPAYLYFTRDLSFEGLQNITLISLTAAVALTLVVNVLGRRPLRRILFNMFCALLGALFCDIFILEVNLMRITEDRHAAAQMENFVKQDFAWLDSGNTGVVTNTRIRAILDTDNAIRNRMNAIDQAEEQIDYAVSDNTSQKFTDDEIDRAFEGDEAGKAAARKAFDSLWPTSQTAAEVKKPLEAVKAALKSKLLGDDRRSRLWSAQGIICNAGRVVSTAADGSKTCTATREELLGFGAKIEREHPYWNRVGEKLDSLLLTPSSK